MVFLLSVLLILDVSASDDSVSPYCLQAALLATVKARSGVGYHGVRVTFIITKGSACQTPVAVVGFLVARVVGGGMRAGKELGPVDWGRRVTA